MRMQQAAVMAGLALSLMSSGAKASIVYTVDFPFASGSASSETLDFTFPSYVNSTTIILDPSTSECKLGTECTSVTFDPGAQFFSSTADTINVTYVVPTPPLPPGIILPPGVTLPPTQSIGQEFDFMAGAFSKVGTYAAVNSSMAVLTVTDTSLSAVPLPASAPMFGAAVLTLGLAGYGVKRSKASAAA